MRREIEELSRRVDKERDAVKDREKDSRRVGVSKAVDLHS